MSVKKVLFIDDGILDEVVEKLRRKLHRNGFTLEAVKIDLESSEFKENTPEGARIDFSKIKEFVEKECFAVSFDVVACDYHYANDPLNGYTILKWIKNVSFSNRERLRKARFVLYSSDGDKFAEKTNTVDDISKLIKIRFDDFLKRENLADDLTKLLLKENDSIDFSRSIVAALEKYPKFKFRSVYPKFKGRPFEDIAHDIIKELPNGVKLQEYLIHLTIAHLINLNSVND